MKISINRYELLNIIYESTKEHDSIIDRSEEFWDEKDEVKNSYHGFDLSNIVDGVCAAAIYEYLKHNYSKGNNCVFNSIEEIINTVSSSLSGVVNDDVISEIVSKFRIRLNEKNEYSVFNSMLIDSYGIIYSAVTFLFFIIPVFFITFAVTEMIYAEYVINGSIEELLEYKNELMFDYMQNINGQLTLEIMKGFFLFYGYKVLVFSVLISWMVFYFLRRLRYHISWVFFKHKISNVDHISASRVFSFLAKRKFNIKKISFFQGDHPYVYRNSKGNPIVVLNKKTWDDINLPKSIFILSHEIYHIINHDYRRSLLVRYLIIIFVIFSFLNSMFNYLELGDFDFSDQVFFLVLLFGLVYSKVINEHRADYFSYRFNGYSLNEVTSYISNSKFRKLKYFGLGYSPRIKYINNPEIIESGLRNIFLLTIIGYIPAGLFGSSIFEASGLSAAEMLLTLSFIIVFSHTISLKQAFNLNNKIYLNIFINWLVSVSILVYLVVGVLDFNKLFTLGFHMGMYNFISPYIYAFIIISLSIIAINKAINYRVFGISFIIIFLFIISLRNDYHTTLVLIFTSYSSLVIGFVCSKNIKFITKRSS